MVKSAGLNGKASFRNFKKVSTNNAALLAPDTQDDSLLIQQNKLIMILKRKGIKEFPEKYSKTENRS